MAGSVRFHISDVGAMISSHEIFNRESYFVPLEPISKETSIRNSLPGFLITLQSSLESKGYLNGVLKEAGYDTAEFRIERIRRNYKFRKLMLDTYAGRCIVYIHYTPRGLRNLACFLAQAPNLGVNTPKVLTSNTTWPYYLQHASVNLVSNYIEGEIFELDTPIEHLGNLGIQLARLHAKRSSKYGPLMTNLPILGSHWGALSRYWRQSIDQISQTGDTALYLPKSEIMYWLQRHGEFLKHFKQFNLCHGDPAGGNFLHQPDGTVYLIDCDHINYGFGAMEIATALLQNYCRGDMRRRERLVESYLQHCTKEDHLIWTKHHRFFIALALFRLSQRKLQWSNKCKKSGSDNRATLAKGLQYWQTFNQLISGSDKGNNWQQLFEDYDQVVLRIEQQAG